MLSPKKSLGQNFLRDDNVARKIVDNLHLRREESILEIGPGQGSLTKYLREGCSTVVAVEVDERAVAFLNDTFGESIELVHADVRTISLAEAARRKRRRLRVIGNIPYNLTSDILFWLLDQHDSVEDATLMVQLEVARRFVARIGTKDYGILSVFVQFYTEPELLFKVSRNSFFPRPSVDSAVVRFSFKTKIPDCDEQLFRTIVRGTFGKRRKTLRNGLRYLGFSQEQLGGISFDLERRPENLSVKDFLDLTAELGRTPAATDQQGAHKAHHERKRQ